MVLVVGGWYFNTLRPSWHLCHSLPSSAPSGLPHAPGTRVCTVPSLSHLFLVSTRCAQLPPHSPVAPTLSGGAFLGLLVVMGGGRVSRTLSGSWPAETILPLCPVLAGGTWSRSEAGAPGHRRPCWHRPERSSRPGPFSAAARGEYPGPCFSRPCLHGTGCARVAESTVPDRGGDVGLKH